MKLVLLLGLAMGALAQTANMNLTCSDVHSIPSDERCSFVREHCADVDYKLGVVDYLDLYYCSPIRAILVPVTITSLLISFISLATTASDYLCPNLYTISKFLNLSDNLAGLTLLAMGNSSADVLSTYKAISVGLVGLAVSELIGAALFILTVVVGSICLLKPFKVPKHHFLRDSSFYLMVSLLILISLVFGRISYFTAFSLGLLYVLYVIVAIYSQSLLRNSSRKKIHAARIRSSYDHESDLPTFESDHTDNMTSLPSIEVLSNDSEEDQKVTAELENYLQAHPHRGTEERVPVQTGSYGLRVLLRELSKYSIRLHTSPSFSQSQIGLLGDRPLTAPATTQVTDNTERGTPPILTQESPSTPPEVKNSSFSRTLFPWFLLPDFNRGAPLPYLVLQVLSYPSNILFTLTIPNRERAIEYGAHRASFFNAFTFQLTGLPHTDEQFLDYDYVADNMLFKVQVIFSNLFVALYYFYGERHSYIYFAFALAVSVALCISIPLKELQFEGHFMRYKVMNYLGSFIGFSLSVLWISIFATEIVAILKTVSLVFNMSESILGVTIFAFGNSIGDLVSNLTIAGMGMPVMAFSACFGGPLLSLCSLGVSCIMNMSHNNTGEIMVEFTPTLKLNVFSLFFALVFIATTVPRNGWKFDRFIGACLISIWLFAVVASIALETTI